MNDKFFKNKIYFQTSTSLLMLFVKDLEILILFGTFSEFLFIGVAISAVIYLRLTRPKVPDTIQVSIFKTHQLLASFYINLQNFYSTRFQFYIRYFSLLFAYSWFH